MRVMIAQTYEEGLTRGEEWAHEDQKNYTPASDTCAMLREEAQTDQRWARAFYLGALRGYRSVARTLKAGRWGV